MRNDPTYDDPIIEIGPRRRSPWRYAVLALLALLFLFGSRLLGIYVDALWFSSVGYADVYWYKFRLGGLLFIIFLILTFLILRLPFFLLDRALPQLTERPRIRPTSVEDLREINFLPLVYRPGVWALSALVALLYAINMTQQWPAFALYLNAAPAGVSDPIFNRDASFYLFKLPVLELAAGWLGNLALLLFVVVTGAAVYTWYIERVRGFGAADTGRRATAAISLAAAFFALTLAVNAWLNRFDYLHTRHDLFTGVSYTDANVRLPGLMVVAIVLLLAAIAFAANAFVWKRTRLLYWGAGAVIAVWLLALLIIPQAIYSFSVKPNELAKESPYIQHNITMTRRAFALDRFEEIPFQPAPTLAASEIRASQQMLRNIRLWDPQVLQSTISQIQEIRTYYEFRVPDIDRYIINGAPRQVMLAAREMNVEQLPDQSRNWINQHLVYTHGYGVTMATVNEFTPEGLPNLVLKDMPVKSDVPEIQVTRPEIYFGELTNQHVYVRTKAQGTTAPEFNFPAPGDADSYNEYDGKAGIAVGGLFRQSVLSFYLGDGTNLLFSDYITSESRVILRRNVSERVSQIAPFLIYEDDPYIVISRDGKLYWIIDAYTHSDRYPYARAYAFRNRGVNYLRNSVKAVVDAYEGDVAFYVFEPDDPIVRSYQGIFPSLFRPGSEMPEDLYAHIRYPEMFADVQAQAYITYHMQSPQTFYNREDLWAIPTAEATVDGNQEPTPMTPYYVQMRLPGEAQGQLEFVSILPFTPTGEGRNNMIGWMAARSDGEHYGQTRVYTFPKNLTVSGPAQIRARVNQDAQLSGQITLWNQQGSRVIRGNLQVIPLADSLLYIEPFYLRAQNSPLPELRQVAVATQDRLATGKTFDEALGALFTELASQRPAAPTEGQMAAPPTTQTAQAPPQPQQPPPATNDVERLARQAQQLFADYKRATSEGRHREAGEKLDQLERTLSEMNRKRSSE
ncbi:MAG TPA: UPF0182 family protein [Blastocatellia bacterium]|nr:UPF0182 family protein [Blastocatellia bacterium]